MSLDDLIARLRWAARTPFFRIPLVSNDRRMSLRGEDLREAAEVLTRLRDAARQVVKDASWDDGLAVVDSRLLEELAHVAGATED